MFGLRFDWLGSSSARDSRLSVHLRATSYPLHVSVNMRSACCAEFRKGVRTAIAAADLSPPPQAGAVAFPESRVLVRHPLDRMGSAKPYAEVALRAYGSSLSHKRRMST